MRSGYSLVSAIPPKPQKISELFNPLIIYPRQLRFQTKERTGDVFLDMGVGYVLFAMEEKHLFRYLTANVPDEDHAKTLQEKYMAIQFEKLAEKLSDYWMMENLSKADKEKLLFKMWIFSHGLAVLINNAVISPYNEKEITDLLLETGLFITEGAKKFVAGDA